MAKLKFEPYIESSFATIAECEVVANIKMRRRWLALARKSNLSRPQSGYIINRAQVVPPVGGGEPRDTECLAVSQ